VQSLQELRFVQTLQERGRNLWDLCAPKEAEGSKSLELASYVVHVSKVPK